MTQFPSPVAEEYKGFSIEPNLNFYRIVFNGKKHRLFFSEGSSFDLSINIAKAKSYSSIEFCKLVIDEIVKDHSDWVESLNGRKVARTTQDSVVY